MTLRACGKLQAAPFFLFMAFLARHMRMRTFQRKCSGSVIKFFNGFTERGIDIMTFPAIGTQSALVNIPMAGNTPGVFQQICL